MKITIDATPQLLALVLLAAAIGIAIWAYRTRYPVLSGRRQTLLLTARLLALGAVVFASLSPVIRFPETSRSRNRLLVLVDHSGSMAVRDGAGGRSRLEIADSMATVAADAARARYDVRVAAFDASLGPFGRDSRAAAAYPGGGETALGDALRSALTRTDPDSVAAILVVGDGSVNRGEDPDAAVGGAIPTFGISVGSTADPPTVGIAGVEPPPEWIVGRPTPLLVTVRQGARPASSGIVRVSEEGRELGRAPFALSGPGASARVSVPVTVATRGKRFLTVELLDVPGDSMRENKRQLIAVDARPARRTVPVLAGPWDWDLRSLARGVQEDTTWGVVRLSPVGSSQVLAPGAAPASLASTLADAEAAAVRYDASAVTPERAAALQRFLDEGHGLLLWLPPRARMPSATPLVRSVGVVWRGWGEPRGPVASIELTPAGRTHEITLLGGDGSSATATWRELPPIEPIAMLGLADSPLTPLLVGRVGNESIPILLAGNVGRGRVAFLNAAGVYRWGLTASGMSARAGVEAAFYGGLVRWLAGVSEDRPVRLVAPDITPEGRPVSVRLTAAGRTAGAEALVIARPSGRGQGSVTERRLSPGSAGEWSGSLPLPPGVYTLSGRVAVGGRSVGSDSLRVAVGAQGIEYENLAADPAALRRLAEGTGAIAAPSDSAGPVLERLRSAELARSRLAEIDLFHNPMLFAILIGALGLEWTMRRRFHLM